MVKHIQPSSYDGKKIDPIKYDESGQWDAGDQVNVYDLGSVAKQIRKKH